VVIGRAQDGYGCRLPGGAISAMMGHGDRGVMVDKIVGVMSVVASISAAGFWLWASLVNVPDNIDTFVGKLTMDRAIECGGGICRMRCRNLCSIYVLATDVLIRPI
jgi:hypothetical protein